MDLEARAPARPLQHEPVLPLGDPLSLNRSDVRDFRGVALRAQAQGELQGQLQGQGQGEYQGQSQHQSSDNYNVNGNLNCDTNANDNANCNINANYNTSVTTVCVDVKVSEQISESPQQAAIDMSCLKIDMPCNDGIVNLMPENIYQTIDGSGSNAAAGASAAA